MNRIVITDWHFCVSKPCEVCGKKPIDYWRMIKTKGLWMCENCFWELLNDPEGFLNSVFIEEGD